MWRCWIEGITKRKISKRCWLNGWRYCCELGFQLVCGIGWLGKSVVIHLLCEQNHCKIRAKNSLCYVTIYYQHWEHFFPKEKNDLKPIPQRTEDSIKDGSQNRTGSRTLLWPGCFETISLVGPTMIWHRIEGCTQWKTILHVKKHLRVQVLQSTLKT